MSSEVLELIRAEQKRIKDGPHQTLAIGTVPPNMIVEREGGAYLLTKLAFGQVGMMCTDACTKKEVEVPMGEQVTVISSVEQIASLYVGVIQACA